MKIGKWLVLTGGLFLIIGLYLALSSSHSNNKVMGEAALGVAVFAPDEDSPEWKEKQRLRKSADCKFNWGLALTGIGVVLQTVGGIIPLKE